MSGKYAAAKPEYATAQIAVWWDMKDFRIPEGYDARQVRPSIEAAFKKLGYFGPVSITAYADHKQTSDHHLQGLSSTGIAVTHTKSAKICKVMFSDMLEWRAQNPPPATMMLISNQVEDVFSWDLARLQQETMYNLFLAYSVGPPSNTVLVTSAEWLWESLLDDNKHETTRTRGELGAMFYCKPCSLDCQSLESFRKHLSTKKHAVEEARNSCTELDPVTRKWAKNYAAKPEHATAKIAVWWDMDDCPVPEGYDARWVRPSIEEEFKKLGYTGPVSITAYGDLKQTPDRLLRGLSSTGVALAHTIPDVRLMRMNSDLMDWQDDNPPPATIMLISDHVELIFSSGLVHVQQRNKYNLFLAYSFRPYKMSVLVTSAEWLWETLLAVSVSDTRRRVLQKCSERSESTGMFSCKLCFEDYKRFDDFRMHLSSDDLAQEEASIISSIQSNERNHEYWLRKRVENEQTFEESSPGGSCSSS
uniref:C2H2-type domain-containing protein n=1 Tax=Noccaea caerulescens TaxID=107243 RepID=A0A1J3K048_NOCCA